MPNFYLPPSAWTETPFLDGDEAKHLSQVLRLAAGANVTVFDGLGNYAEARVLSVSKQRVDLLLDFAESAADVAPEITLVQAIPKGKNMDWIIQKAVELGVSRIQPLITRRTIVSPGEDKAEKWRRTALEACKQCGQFYVPKIEEPLGFAEWLIKREPSELELIASLADQAISFREVLSKYPSLSRVSYLVGPEGDFSPEETQQALDSGFSPVSLGELVLRVETATLFGLSAIRYQFL